MRIWIEPDGEMGSDTDDSGELFELLTSDKLDEIALHAVEANEEFGRELIELRAKYDREVEAHRQNCVALRREQTRRIDAERAYAGVVERAFAAENKLREISEAFMLLHNLAKDVVGPKQPSDRERLLEAAKQNPITRQELEDLLGL